MIIGSLFRLLGFFCGVDFLEVSEGVGSGTGELDTSSSTNGFSPIFLLEDSFFPNGSSSGISLIIVGVSCLSSIFIWLPSSASTTLLFLVDFLKVP